MNHSPSPHSQALGMFLLLLTQILGVGWGDAASLSPNSTMSCLHLIRGKCSRVSFHWLLDSCFKASHLPLPWYQGRSQHWGVEMLARSPIGEQYDSASRRVGEGPSRDPGKRLGYGHMCVRSSTLAMQTLRRPSCRRRA